MKSLSQMDAAKQQCFKCRSTGLEGIWDHNILPLNTADKCIIQFPNKIVSICYPHRLYSNLV